MALSQTRKFRHLLTYLDTHSTAVARLSAATVRDPSTGSVHKLRVAIRRTRVAFWLLRHSSRRMHFKKLDSHLRRLAKALGCVRELNVAIRDADYYEMDSTRLNRRERSEQKRLRKLLSANKRKKLACEITAAKEKVRRLSPTRFTDACEDLSGRLNRHLKRPIHGQTSFHRLRISLKRARYALEAMGKPVEPLKPILTLLGDAHDLEFLQSLMGKDAKIKCEQRALNKKALRLAKRSIRYAVTQLGYS